MSEPVKYILQAVATGGGVIMKQLVELKPGQAAQLKVVLPPMEDQASEIVLSLTPTEPEKPETT